MSRKTLLMVVGSAALGLLGVLALYLLLAGSNRLEAKLIVTTGNQPGKSLTSQLECKGGSAKGDGIYRFPKKAQAGCKQVQLLRNELTRAQSACPKAQRDGERVLIIKGVIDGQPVLFEQFNQTGCLPRVRQLARLTSFVETAQASPPRPSFTVIVTPPPPPVLTPEDRLRIDRQIAKKGKKAYEREQAIAIRREAKSSKKISRCPLPLPEVYSTCYIQITMRPNEDEQEALKRVRTENPDWFNNDQQPNVKPPSVSRQERKRLEDLRKQADKLAIPR